MLVMLSVPTTSPDSASLRANRLCQVRRYQLLHMSTLLPEDSRDLEKWVVLNPKIQSYGHRVYLQSFLIFVKVENCQQDIPHLSKKRNLSNLDWLCRVLAPSNAPFVAGGTTAPAGWASFGEGNAFMTPPPTGGASGGDGGLLALEGPPTADVPAMSATAPTGTFDPNTQSFE